MKFDPKFVRNLLFLYEEADFAGVNEKELFKFADLHNKSRRELLDTIAIMNKGKLVTNKIHYAGKPQCGLPKEVLQIRAKIILIRSRIH